MSSTLAEKAVVGRRILFTYYRDLKRPNPPQHPGIITALLLNQGSCGKIRLDGKRSSLHIPPHYQGLRYLDEIVLVPELPMGRFTATAEHLGGAWAGVPVCCLDSEDVIALTDDLDKARTAVTAYLKETGWDINYVDLDRLQPRWAVFEWQPEDSDAPWTVRWDVSEGDDMAVRIHYLPA